MLNNCIIVGRLTSDIEINDDKSTMILAVPRRTKNEEGIYETDNIKVDLSLPIAKNTAEYLKIGDLLSVKGRLENRNIENSDDKELTLIAERIAFLSSRKQDEMER